MRPGGHFIPGDDDAGAVATEHGVRGVVQIRRRVVIDGRQHSVLVRAGRITPEGTEQPPPALGVGGHLPGVVPQSGHRHSTSEHSLLPRCLRRRQLRPHLLEVRHGPAYLRCGQLQAEVVPGLQQDALRLHQPLAHRPIGGLAEVAALRVLHVGPARRQGDLHIRNGGAGQHPQVLLLRQMGQDQPLPTALQLVLRAGRPELQAAAPLPRLQQQMDLCIVAQGLKVADALYWGGDGLPITDGAGAEGHLQLDLPHQLHVDLAGLLIPGNVELGILLLQLAQIAQGSVGIRPLRQQHLIGQHRLQRRGSPAGLKPQALSRPAAGETCHGAHRPRRGLLQGTELVPGVEAQLVRFFLPAFLPYPTGDELLGVQGAAGDLQPGEPRPLIIPGDFKDPCPEVPGILLLRQAALQAGQELLHPLQLQG